MNRQPDNTNSPQGPNSPPGFWKQNFPALLEPGLRRYLTGQLVSFMGAWAQNVALNLLVYEIARSAWLLGLLNFLLYGPMLFVAPMAGGWLSHQRVKRILLAVLMANAAISATLWWYAASNQANLPLLFALALVSGGLSAVELPARLVFIAASLRDHSIMSNALSLNVLANNFARMAGAPIGAVLFSAFGAGIAFAACLSGLIFMAASVTTISVISRKGPPQPSAGLAEGLRYVRAEPFPSFYLPAIGLVGLFAGSYSTLVPILGGIEFGNASRYTGLFLSCAGAGAVVASVVLSSRFAPRAVSRLIYVSHWVACLGLAAIAVSPNPVLAGIGFFALGGSITFTNTASSAAMLQRCPERVRGSLAGLYSMAFAGLLPFGHLLAGALSSYFGVRWTFFIMSVALLGALAGLLRLHRRVHGADGARLRW